MYTPRNVFPDCDGNNSIIERFLLKWLMKDYCCVESTQMYPPQPFRCILSSMGKWLAHKQIKQMPLCHLRHANAFEWNPVGYFVVSLYGSPSGPDRYQSCGLTFRILVSTFRHLALDFLLYTLSGYWRSVPIKTEYSSMVGTKFSLPNVKHR